MYGITYQINDFHKKKSRLFYLTKTKNIDLIRAFCFFLNYDTLMPIIERVPLFILIPSQDGLLRVLE